MCFVLLKQIRFFFKKNCTKYRNRVPDCSIRMDNGTLRRMAIKKAALNGQPFPANYK